MRHGACCGTPLSQFFPERGEDVRPAKQICAGCVVRLDCLDYAMADPCLTGIWGGTSERERREPQAGTMHGHRRRVF